MIQPFYFAADMICSQCSVYKIITARSVSNELTTYKMGVFSTEINESGLILTVHSTVCISYRFHMGRDRSDIL